MWTVLTEKTDMRTCQTKNNPQKPGGRWSEFLPMLTTRQPVSHAIVHTASCSHFTRPLPRSLLKVPPACLEAQCLHAFLVLHLLSVCPPNTSYCPVTSAPSGIPFLSDLWHCALPDLISLYGSEGHSNNGPHRWAKQSRGLKKKICNVILLKLGCGHTNALNETKPCTKGAKKWTYT